MKARMISRQELRYRAKGVLPRHFETFKQYLIRLKCLPNKTNPITYLPYSKSILNTDCKGFHVN